MEPIRHTEFFDNIHFEHHYHKCPPSDCLAHFIDFFWETRFNPLWPRYPDGFCDILFPDTGYAYLINLGTPFTLRLGGSDFEMKADGFLPRHNSMECFYKPGNRLFGIKFKISPLILEKKINFSEYHDFIFPLSYLLEAGVTRLTREAKGFHERVTILCNHYQAIVEKHRGSRQPAHIITRILDQCSRENDFRTPVEAWARNAGISSRNLQRYFEMCTGGSGKKILQILRIRKAVQQIASSPETFHYSRYGYFDHSHFYKHLKSFLHHDSMEHLKPHLKILQELHQLKVQQKPQPQ